MAGLGGGEGLGQGRVVGGVIVSGPDRRLDLGGFQGVGLFAQFLCSFKRPFKQPFKQLFLLAFMRLLCSIAAELACFLGGGCPGTFRVAVCGHGYSWGWTFMRAWLQPFRGAMGWLFS